MSGPVLFVVVLLLFPVGVIFWNRNRVKGKIGGYFLRKDKSLVFQLCELKDAFVLFNEKAYDLYPDFIRVARFPMGWPPFLQEIIPVILYDEEDAIPLDWVDLQIDKRRESSTQLRSALGENWIKKLVQETASEGQHGLGFNWRRVAPMLLMGFGAVGLILLLTMK